MNRIKTIHDRVNWLRGRFITEVAVLEKMMDIYIVSYFVPGYTEKAKQMHLILFADGRLTLEQKRQMFHFIAETNDSEWYKSYQSGLFDNKSKSIDFNRDFVRIIEIRNILAHRLYEPDEEAWKQNGTINFFTLKNVVDKFSIDNTEISKLHKTLEAMCLHFKEKIDLKLV